MGEDGWGRGTFMARLDAADRAELAALGKVIRVGAGAVVFGPGAEADAAYVVRSGQVWLQRCGADGSLMTLGARGAGEVFGLAELFTGVERAVEARSLHDCRLLRVPAPRFLGWMAARPAVTRLVLEILGGRVRESGGALASLAGDPSEVRVARLLLAMAEPAPADQVRLRITQREVAELVSASRQTVSLALGKLKRLGALAVGRGEVVVKVPVLGAALARIEVG